MIWKILGIEETKDEEQIKNAYRDKLRFVNPEDDQEGFMELRQAYEDAIAFANQIDNPSVGEQEELFQTRKNDVDLWIDKVDRIYEDVALRIDEKKWQVLLKDEVCENLDTELEAGEKLLVYFMSHSNMPQHIWQLVDKRFGYLDSMNQLKEKFPENYLEYVKWQITKPGFIDYNLFDGITNKDVDTYINKIYEAKAASEDKDLQHLQQVIKELKRFDVSHPFAQVEEARCLMIEAEGFDDNAMNNQALDVDTDDKRSMLLADALSIMEELDFEYGENPYIERIYADTLIANKKIDRARSVYEELIERDASNYMAILGVAKCTFLEGNAEDAKEQIEDVLEDRVQDVDALNLLDTVNEVLVEKYEEQIQKEEDPELYYKLGWCYYQQKRFEDGIHLLDGLAEYDEYDYVNLRCRLYLANDNYKLAKPLVEKWLKMIEESVDDGSKEMTKRKNRLSLAHFSLGICAWEESFKNANEEDKDAIGKEVVHYFHTAIEEENNFMVKLSYMEQLARFYIDAKRFEDCILQCNEILEKDRGFFPAYVHRQKAHHELRNAKEVIDDYFACIELYPAYAPPYVFAAEVFYAFDQYDDIEQVLESAKEAGIESDALELYRIRCIHYKDFSKENTEKALKMLVELREKVNAAKPEETDIDDLVEIEREYAILHWDLDNTNMTLSIIDECLKKNPDSTTMLHLKADVLVRERQHKESVEVCKRLVELEPDNLHTKTKLGNCYERIDDTEQAIACYESILQINPEFVPAIRRMMYMYSYLSNDNNDLLLCKKAIDYATKYIELTGSSDGYLERGNLYIDLYRLDEAVADCKKAIELDEEAYYAYNNLGCALLKLRRLEEAILPLEKAIALDPDKDHLPYLNLAECYSLTGEYDKAVQMYREVMRLRPRATHLNRKIADVYKKAKRYADAIDIYKCMLAEVKEEKKKKNLSEKISSGVKGLLTEEDKKEQKLYCEIAEVYHQQGNIEKAKEYYAKVEPGRFLAKRVCAKAISDAAEFYRDNGDLDKADELLQLYQAHSCLDEVDTQDYEHLDFVRATVKFEKGDCQSARKYADRFLEAFLKRQGGEEAILGDERYCRMLVYVLVVMHICAGRVEKAKDYVNRMKPCHLCVTCEYQDCYEYYFALGLIAELEGDIDEAIEQYKRALLYKSTCYNATRHLEKLLETRNI
ncbi:MAG: tetratricopeptide repeat protein [Lachnospiraceae bacterium]|nr:tetratricopeptide repeat protein [Lachnospiraceae bacterium]